MVTGKDTQEYILSGERKKEDVWKMCRKSGSILMTGGAIVKDGKATLIGGPGSDNLLEASSQFPQLDGIIGNGRSILFDTKQKTLYSVHAPEEASDYYRESVTKRDHNYVSNAKSSGKAIVLNLAEGGNTKYHHKREGEIGKGIVIEPSSKKMKKVRNFASKVSHFRNDDIALDWKEEIPMSYDEIYQALRNLDMEYCSVVTPFYSNINVAYIFCMLKDKDAVNPHAPILEKILEAKIL